MNHSLGISTSTGEIYPTKRLGSNQCRCYHFKKLPKMPCVLIGHEDMKYSDCIALLILWWNCYKASVLVVGIIIGVNMNNLWKHLKGWFLLGYYPTKCTHKLLFVSEFNFISMILSNIQQVGILKCGKVHCICTQVVAHWIKLWRDFHYYLPSR